jgi:hypothetical protein
VSKLGEDEGVSELLARCIVSVDGDPASEKFVESISVEQARAIEQALDEVSPDVGTLVETRCPECDRALVVEIDPFVLSEWRGSALFREVHALATHYHWSEREILDLPRERRSMYLGLIEEDHGRFH